jgi:hypothetical protein
MPKPSLEPPAPRPKTSNLAVELPETGFRVVLFFNKFGIEKCNGHLLIHFGFVSVAGEVLATYSALMESTFLTINQSEWLDYLGQVGSPPERPLDVSWRPPSSKIDRIEVINALRLGRLGPNAEFRCYCVSMVAAIDQSRAGAAAANKLVPGQPLALLQTTLEQQQLVLLALIKHDSL